MCTAEAHHARLGLSLAAGGVTGGLEPQLAPARRSECSAANVQRQSAQFVRGALCQLPTRLVRQRHGQFVAAAVALRQYADLIGHIHTAGNPGRGELDEKQEINYRAVMQALVDVDYKGYVGQEFIPTRDALQGLTEAVTLCDV